MLLEGEFVMSGRKRRKKWKFRVKVQPPKKQQPPAERHEQLDRFARALLALVADTNVLAASKESREQREES
jgi:hypothetical protein